MICYYVKIRKIDGQFLQQEDHEQFGCVNDVGDICIHTAFTVVRPEETFAQLFLYLI